MLCHLRALNAVLAHTYHSLCLALLSKMSFEQSVEDATRRFIDVIEDTRPGVIAIVSLAILASLVGAVGIDNSKQLKNVSLMTMPDLVHHLPRLTHTTKIPTI